MPVGPNKIRTECGNKIKTDDQNPLWIWLGQITVKELLALALIKPVKAEHKLNLMKRMR